MNDNVLRPDRRETVSTEFPDTLRKPRTERRKLELRAIFLDQEREIAETQEATLLNEQRIAAAEFLLEHAEQAVADPAFDLQPDDTSAPAPLDRGAEIENQILRLFLQLDIAVAQHAEIGRSPNFVSGKKQRREALDQRFYRDVSRWRAGQTDEARSRRR